MAATNLDLWPALPDVKLRTPVSILREQAALLGQKTKNLLEAEVSTNTWHGELRHSFKIVAPALDYSFELFSVTHGVDLYPSSGKSANQNMPTELPDEDAFIEWVREQLSSERTLRLIQSLLAQVSE
jgi:hypothetical protein